MKTTDEIAAEAAEKQQRGFQLAYGITPHLPDLIADFQVAIEEATKEWRKKAYSLGHDLIRAAHESEGYICPVCGYNTTTGAAQTGEQTDGDKPAAHASEQDDPEASWQDDSPAGKAPDSPLVENYLRMFVQDILHGDEVHRAWLLEAVECFIEGKHIPEPRAKTPIPKPAHASEPWDLPPNEPTISIGKLNANGAVHASERVFDQIEGAKQCIKKGFYAQAELVLNDVLSLRAVQASK